MTKKTKMNKSIVELSVQEIPSSSFITNDVCECQMLGVSVKTSLLQTLILEHDLIEIHYNENLRKNPYLIRVFRYNNDLIEFRFDKNNIKNLYDFL